MSALPIVMGPEGRVNTDPATLRSDLVADVLAIRPGFTADLPASLVEDITSTAVGALVTVDQALTDLINSVTPRGANEFLLRQLSQVYGVAAGIATNTSVSVVFTGPPGFTIAPGFTVGDGTHQYRVQDGGIINGGGVTAPLSCVATIAGSWAVPSTTVTQLVTSVPVSIPLTVSNPNPGLPGAGEESIESYRAAVLQAGQAAAQGMPTLMRTVLRRVSGVQPRLISIAPISGGGWEVMVGGGDDYEVAYAIFTALFDISILEGASAGGTTVTVSINDYPDTYPVPFVRPLAQAVTVSVTWNSNSPNLISDTAVATAGAPALADYINAVYAGKPMNLFEMQEVFQVAVQDIVPTSLLTRMVFAVSINGTPTAPLAGTGVIEGDPEGYFLTDAAGADITITRG